MELTFTSCLEVTEDHVDEALAPVDDLMTPPPRRRVLALLQRMMQVAEPNRGAARLLLVLARLASCAWLEGALVVKLRAEQNQTRFELLVDDGYASERLCPITLVNAPLHEFTRAVNLKPERVSPLMVDTADETKLVLRATLITVDDETDLEIAAQGLLRPEREARPAALEPPAIEWSRPVRQPANPPPPPPLRARTGPQVVPLDRSEPVEPPRPTPLQSVEPPPSSRNTVRTVVPPAHASPLAVAAPPPGPPTPRVPLVEPPVASARQTPLQPIPEADPTPPHAYNPSDIKATMQLPDSQAAEQLARIKLKKQPKPVPSGVVEEVPPSTQRREMPTAPGNEDDLDEGWG